MEKLNLQLIEPDYLDKWTAMMTTIWRERIVRLGAVSTGHLFDSVVQHSISVSAQTISISFDFLEYGIYVDAGTGKGYKRNNGGSLHFLDNRYRAERRLGKPRERRPWYSTSWYISKRVLADYIAKRTGYKLAALFSNI